MNNAFSESGAGDRGRPRRAYRMARRAQLVDDTRQRIVEATVALHTSVGPAATTVAAIADAAGVTRLTVYRHFPDAAHLLTACRAHWRDLHPGPDPRRWAEAADLQTRGRLALSELYGWYRANAGDLGPIFRDVGAMPAASRAEMATTDEQLAAALLGDAIGDPGDPRLAAVARHLVRFPTWVSLTVDGALSDVEAARLGADLLALVQRWDEVPASQAEPSGV